MIVGRVQKRRRPLIRDVQEDADLEAPFGVFRRAGPLEVFAQLIQVLHAEVRDRVEPHAARLEIGVETSQIHHVLVLARDALLRVAGAPFWRGDYMRSASFTCS